MNDIKVEQVQLTLQKTEILKDINMEFEEGKIHGLIEETVPERPC